MPLTRRAARGPHFGRPGRLLESGATNVLSAPETGPAGLFLTSSISGDYRGYITGPGGSVALDEGIQSRLVVESPTTHTH